MSHETISGTVSHLLHIGPNGGVIFAFDCHPPRRRTIRVIADWRVFPHPPLKNEPWSLIGEWRRNLQYGMQFHPSEARPWRPEGAALIRFLSGCELFPMLQRAAANRLWNLFGDALPPVLDAGNLLTLRRARISLRLCKELVEEWRSYWVFAHLRHRLRRLELSDTDIRRIVNLWGRAAESTISRNPYCLVPFASWTAIDMLARETYQVTEDSEARLSGACEAILLEAQRRGRHSLPADTLNRLLAGRLGDAKAAKAAIEIALRTPFVVCARDSAGDSYQGAGVDIIEQAFAERMSEFARAEGSGRWAFESPSLLIDLVRTSVAKAACALTLLAPNALHIVPDSYIKKTDGVSLDNPQFMTLSSALLSPTVASLVSREIFVHGCHGLGLVVLNKLMQRIPIGNAIRLIGFSLPLLLSDGPPIFGTLQASGQFRELRMNTSRSTRSLAKKGDHTEKTHATNPTVTMCASHRWETTGSRESLRAKTAYEFRKALSRGTAAIFVVSSREARDWNVQFHNEAVDYRRLKSLPAPVARLRDDLSATIDEPVVVTRTDPERGLVSGMTGLITYIAHDDATAYHPRHDRSFARVHFDGTGELDLSRNELQGLTLAYSLRPAHAVFGLWDTVIVPSSDNQVFDEERTSLAHAAANIEIVFLCGGMFPDSHHIGAKGRTGTISHTLLAKLRRCTNQPGEPT